MTTPAGWYPDPEQQGQQRYWDGQQWTEHRAPTQPPAPPPTPAPPAASPARQPTIEELRASSARNGKTILLVLGVLIGIMAVIALVDAVVPGSDTPDVAATAAASPSQPESTSPPAPKPEWESTVTDIEVLNPATVRMFVRVENVGKGSGTPKCTLDVNDPGYNYTGFTFVNLKDPIKPGRSANFYTTITVTNEGAAYVTKGKAKCTTRHGG